MDAIEQIAQGCATVIGFLAVWNIIGEMLMSFFMPHIDRPTSVGVGVVDERLHNRGIVSSFVLTVLLFGLMYCAST